MAEPSPSQSWTHRFLANGRYELLRKLGAGGMGVVWLARDNAIGNEVVVKMPHLSLLLERADFAQRFEREVRTLKHLRHPNIVPIVDVGQEGQMPYVVLAYLTGGSLHDRLQAMRGLHDPGDLGYWLPDIASALDFMHRQGYIHRDVKPANILFDRVGRAYLCDFGLAKLIDASQASMQLTRAGGLIGTPAYFAPEIAVGSCDIDYQSDQYSLAVVVYEALAGRLPFQSDTPQGFIVQHASMTPAPIHLLNPLVSLEQSEALTRALQKNPSQRFASCGELAIALLRSVEASSIPTGSSGHGRPGRPASEPARPAAKPVKGTTHVSLASQSQTVPGAAPRSASAQPVSRTGTRPPPPPSRATEPRTGQRLSRGQGRGRGWGRRMVWAGLLLGLLGGGGWVGYRWLHQPSETGLAPGGDGQATPITPVVLYGNGPPPTNPLDPLQPPPPVPAPNTPLTRPLAPPAADAAPWRRLHSIQVAPNLAVQVLLSPDGRLAVTGDVLGRVLVWDVQTGQKLRELGQFDSPIGKLAMSGDGRVVAACGSDAERTLPNWYDRHVRVWKLNTGKLIGEFGLLGPPLDLALDPIGERLAVATKSRGVLLWAELGPEQQPVILGADQPERKSYQAVAFAPDGERLLAIARTDQANEGEVRCYRINDGHLLTTQHHDEPLRVLGCSQTGTTVVVGDANGQLHAKSLDGKTPPVSERPHTLPITGLCVRGQSAISVSRDGSIRRCQLPKLNQLQVLESGNGPIASLAVSEDGQWIAVGLDDGRLLIATLTKE
jgi:serine/threonine protein kinase